MMVLSLWSPCPKEKAICRDLERVWVSRSFAELTLELYCLTPDLEGTEMEPCRRELYSADFQEYCYSEGAQDRENHLGSAIQE